MLKHVVCLHHRGYASEIFRGLWRKGREDEGRGRRMEQKERGGRESKERREQRKVMKGYENSHIFKTHRSINLHDLLPSESSER
jgi:hypothetical protein